MPRDPDDKLFTRHALAAAAVSGLSPCLLGVTIAASALGGAPISNIPFFVAFLFSVTALATMYALAHETGARAKNEAQSPPAAPVRLKLLYGAALGLIAGGIVIFTAVVAVFFFG